MHHILPQFIINSAIHAGSAAAAGELENDDKYDEDVSLSGSSFYPLIAETLGIWSPNSLRILKIIALRSAVTSNLSASQAVMDLHEQLSVCLWRYNAKMLLNRVTWTLLDWVGWDESVFRNMIYIKKKNILYIIVNVLLGIMADTVRKKLMSVLLILAPMVETAVIYSTISTVLVLPCILVSFVRLLIPVNQTLARMSLRVFDQIIGRKTFATVQMAL